MAVCQTVTNSATGMFRFKRGDTSTAHNTGAQCCWLILLGTDGQTEKGGSLRQDVPGCNKTLTFFTSPTCSLSAPRREMRRSSFPDAPQISLEMNVQ